MLPRTSASRLTSDEVVQHHPKLRRSHAKVAVKNEGVSPDDAAKRVDLTAHAKDFPPVSRGVRYRSKFFRAGRDGWCR
jgi:hypothetical protein